MKHALVLLALMAACTHHTTAPVELDLTAGAYRLVSVDGHTLPYTFSPSSEAPRITETLVAGGLTFGADDTWSAWRQLTADFMGGPIAQLDTDGGACQYAGESVTLFSTPGTVPHLIAYSGAFSRDTLSLSDGRSMYVFVTP